MSRRSVGLGWPNSATVEPAAGVQAALNAGQAVGARREKAHTPGGYAPNGG
jgi:hypothetical protein